MTSAIEFAQASIGYDGMEVAEFNQGAETA
jgi:hypothetical protein